jgi:hypothetical protein
MTTKISETIPAENSVDSIKNSRTRDIAHNKESAIIVELNPEWGGAPLIQEEKYKGKGDLRDIRFHWITLLEIASSLPLRHTELCGKIHCYSTLSSALAEHHPMKAY